MREDFREASERFINMHILQVSESNMNYYLLDFCYFCYYTVLSSIHS